MQVFNHKLGEWHNTSMLCVNADKTFKIGWAGYSKVFDVSLQSSEFPAPEEERALDRRGGPIIKANFQIRHYPKHLQKGNSVIVLGQKPHQDVSRNDCFRQS